MPGILNVSINGVVYYMHSWRSHTNVDTEKRGYIVSQTKKKWHHKALQVRPRARIDKHVFQVFIWRRKYKIVRSKHEMHQENSGEN